MTLHLWFGDYKKLRSKFVGILSIFMLLTRNLFVFSNGFPCTGFKLFFPGKRVNFGVVGRRSIQTVTDDMKGMSFK